MRKILKSLKMNWFNVLLLLVANVIQVVIIQQLLPGPTGFLISWPFAACLGYGLGYLEKYDKDPKTIINIYIHKNK